MANNTKAAGRITGSPLCGLCERVCIEAKKISDGCIGRFGNVTFTVTLSDFTGGMTTPYTFERAVSSGATTLENLTVTAIRGNRSRVAFDSFIPITVYYTDAALRGRQKAPLLSVAMWCLPCRPIRSCRTR